LNQVGAVQKKFGNNNFVSLTPMDSYLLGFFILSKMITYTYLMVNHDNGFYKIGKSIKPKFRERTLQSNEPNVELLGYCDSNIIAEKSLHEKFKDKRIRGEWFNLNKDDIEYIMSYTSKDIVIVDDFIPSGKGHTEGNICKINNENYVIKKSKSKNLLYDKQTTYKYKINNKKIIEQHIELYHIDGINYGDWSICRRDRKDITNNNFIAKNPYPNDYRGYNNFATLYSIILKSNCLYTYHLLRVILFSFFMNEKQTDEALFSDLFISYKTINAEDKPSNYSFAKRYNVMFDK
jgi:hypothetical protein